MVGPPEGGHYVQFEIALTPWPMTQRCDSSVAGRRCHSTRMPRHPSGTLVQQERSSRSSRKSRTCRSCRRAHLRRRRHPDHSKCADLTAGLVARDAACGHFRTAMKSPSTIVRRNELTAPFDSLTNVTVPPTEGNAKAASDCGRTSCFPPPSEARWRAGRQRRRPSMCPGVQARSGRRPPRARLSEPSCRSASRHRPCPTSRWRSFSFSAHTFSMRSSSATKFMTGRIVQDVA